ncbi:MAG: hypothetical protein ACSHW0_15890 [Thalassotalea sp.]
MRYFSRRDLITIAELAGILLGLLSVILAWYYGTRKKRLKKKLSDHEDKLSKIKKYSSQTGYKNMLHDCFFTFSYVGGIVLLTLGIKSAAAFVVPNFATSKIFDLFISGIFIGSGMVLLELFILLGKVNKPKDTIESMKSKIEKIRSEIS